MTYQTGFTKAAAGAMLTASLVLGAPVSNAGVLFENALVGVCCGNNPFTGANTFGAENFTLASASTVESIAFNGFHGPTSQPTSIEWKILAGDAGLPGAVLSSGNSAYTVILKGTNSGYKLLDYVIDIPDLALAAGAYWVAFHPVGNSGDPHWTIVSSGDALSAISYDGGATWSDSYPCGNCAGGGLAFRVEGGNGVVGNAVPEPGTLALFALGAIGLTRRRRA